MDISTAMLLWATEGLTLAVPMVVVWLHDRKQTVTGLWGLGFGLHGLGVALIGLRGVIPDSVSIIAGNGLALCGVVGWTLGILVYDKKRPGLWLAAPLLMWLAVLCIPSVMAHFWARTVTFQLCSAVAYLMLAYCIVKGGSESRFVRLCFTSVVSIQATLFIKMAFDSYKLQPTGFNQLPNITAFAVINIFCLVAGILLGGRLLMARSEQRLHHLAASDPLTGVLNRRGLLDSFNDMVRHVPAGRPLMALVIFDLDHFKLINDRHGHSMGDSVLMVFCRVARACLGDRGTFGRMGGEEFACLMHVSSPAEASGVTEAIRLTLCNQQIDIAGAESTICATVSAGIALAPVGSAKLDQMLLIADRALYAAKAAGRNRTALASGSGSEISVIADPGRLDEIANPPLAETKAHSSLPSLASLHA